MSEFHTDVRCQNSIQMSAFHNYF